MRLTPAAPVQPLDTVTMFVGVPLPVICIGHAWVDWSTVVPE